MVSDHENPNKSGTYWGFGFFVIGLEGRCSIQLSYGRVLRNQRLAEIISTLSASPNHPPQARTANGLGPSRRKPSGRQWTICDGRMPVQGMSRKRTTVSDPRVNGSSACTTPVRSGPSSSTRSSGRDRRTAGTRRSGPRRTAARRMTWEGGRALRRRSARPSRRCRRLGEAAGHFVVGPPARRDVADAWRPAWPPGGAEGDHWRASARGRSRPPSPRSTRPGSRRR